MLLSFRITAPIRVPRLRFPLRHLSEKNKTHKLFYQKLSFFKTSHSHTLNALNTTSTTTSSHPCSISPARHVIQPQTAEFALRVQIGSDQKRRWVLKSQLVCVVIQNRRDPPTKPIAGPRTRDVKPHGQAPGNLASRAWCFGMTSGARKTNCCLHQLSPIIAQSSSRQRVLRLSTHK